MSLLKIVRAVSFQEKQECVEEEKQGKMLSIRIVVNYVIQGRYHGAKRKSQ